MIQVSCRATIEFSLLVACDKTDPTIAIVQGDMHKAAMQVALNLKQLNAGYEVRYIDPWLTAYSVP